jgi:hypothetical protein
LFFNEPPHYLPTIENELPGPARPEMWQASPHALLPDGPGGAPDEPRYFGNAKRLAEDLGVSLLRLGRCGHCSGQFWPRLALRIVNDSKRFVRPPLPYFPISREHVRPRFSLLPATLAIEDHAPNKLAEGKRELCPHCPQDCERERQEDKSEKHARIGKQLMNERRNEENRDRDEKNAGN